MQLVPSFVRQVAAYIAFFALATDNHWALCFILPFYSVLAAFISTFSVYMAISARFSTSSVHVSFPLV